MFRLLCLLCLAGVALADIVVVNQVIDQALTGLNAAITQAKKAQIQLTDMDENWNYSWHFAKFSGHIQCYLGTAQDLASIYRTEDVTVETDGNRTTLKVPLKLGNLTTFYYCYGKAEHLFSLVQGIGTSAPSNSIDAQVTLTRNGDRCSADLDFIRVRSLGYISITPGDGILHMLDDHFLRWFTDKYNGEIVDKINQVHQEQAVANFLNADFCNKIPH